MCILVNIFTTKFVLSGMFLVDFKTFSLSFAAD